MYISDVLSSMGVVFSIRGDVEYDSDKSLSEYDIQFIGESVTDEQYHAAATALLVKIKQDELTSFLGEFINQEAIKLGYDSTLSFISYFNSTKAKWKDEATIFLKWRDDCFIYLENYLDTEPNPSIEDFKLNLPALGITVQPSEVITKL